MIGITDKPSSRGHSVGMGMNYHLGNFQIGVSYARITQNININPLTDGLNKGTSVTFDDLYFDLLENYYHRQEFVKRDAYYMNLGYRINFLKKFAFTPRIGYGYTNSKRIILIIDSSEPYLPHASYIEFLTDAYLWKFDFNLDYNIYKTLFIGIRYHYEDSFNNNDSILATLRVNI